MREKLLLQVEALTVELAKSTAAANSCIEKLGEELTSIKNESAFLPKFKVVFDKIGQFVEREKAANSTIGQFATKMEQLPFGAITSVITFLVSALILALDNNCGKNYRKKNGLESHWYFRVSNDQQ